MFHYLNLDSININNKIIGIRSDINSPVIDGKVHMNERIEDSCKTIKEVSDKGGISIIFAHQSRKGKPDCVSLREHKRLLEGILKKKIHFLEEINLKNIKEELKKLRAGDILLLENLRFLDEEVKPEIKKNKIIDAISICDFYVFDAFSVAHRKHSSVIGSEKTINIAGRLMERELNGLKKIEEKKKNRAFVFGGAKPDDLLELIEFALSKNEVEEIFLSGVIGEISLMIKGYYLGKKKEIIRENGWDKSIKKLKELIEKFPEKFVFPIDVAYLDKKNKRVEVDIDFLKKGNSSILDEVIIEDIGTGTCKLFSSMFDHYDSIYFKGPQGDFEKKGMDVGTRMILKGIVESGSFCFLGGGHSVSSAEDFGYLNKFSYVSLAGGALVSYLSGDKLPGIESLEKSFKKYKSDDLEFIVVGTNVIDTEVSVPLKFSEIILGSKIKVEEDFKKTIGGGGVNMSICLSRLGGNTAYLGKLSYETEKDVIRELDKNNVKVLKNKVSKKQGSKSIILDTLDNDRVIFSYRGQNRDLKIEDCNFIDTNIKYYLFTSFSGESFLTLFKLAKKIKDENKSSKICYTPQIHLIEKETKKVVQFIKKYVDVLVLNLEEASFISSSNSISENLKFFYKLGLEIIVITCGSNGAYAYDGVNEFNVKSKKTKVVDTTGAGDCFSTTFYYFYCRGVSIEKCLKYAAINSSSVISRKGAIDGLLYLEDLI